jgi:hypothetical protein
MAQRLALTRNKRSTLGIALIYPMDWFNVLDRFQCPDTAILPLVKKVVES